MSDLDVLLDPKEIVVSALAPALGITLENPIGREIIQGMDYESGKWTENGNTYFVQHRFTRQHNNAPILFLVHASTSGTTFKSSTLYGQLFIDYYNLLGYAPRYSNTPQFRYASNIIWTTESSTTSISQEISTITSRTSLTNYATNEYFVFGNANKYIRDGLVYNWVAIFMPE